MLDNTLFSMAKHFYLFTKNNSRRPLLVNTLEQ